MTIPDTRNRVERNTSSVINQRVRDETASRVRALAGSPQLIGTRLKELNEEWDVERAIEANASSLAFLGVVLGFAAHPYWLLLPALVTAFLFQHAIQGWCPPIPVLRRLGYRTATEIETERNALKVLRGDYEGKSSSPPAALKAAEL